MIVWMKLDCVNKLNNIRLPLEISQNTQENTCASFLIKLQGWNLQQAEACIFISKETLAQVFSCEICEISKNAFFKKTSFYRTPPVAASIILPSSYFVLGCNFEYVVSSFLNLRLSSFNGCSLIQLTWLAWLK